MITNSNKKVICIKDIPSNIIEEAIFILKSDERNGERIRRKEFAMIEAENFVNDYIQQENLEDDEIDIEYSPSYKLNKINLKMRIILIAGVVLGIMTIITCLIKYLK